MALSAIVATFMFGMVPVSDAAPLLTIVGAETGSQSGSTRTLSSHGDWQVQCDTGDAISCRMSIGAEATSANGTHIAIELVGERPAKGEPLFYVRAPLDLLVANGMELRLTEGKALRLSYRSCHAAGCLAPFRLTGEIAARFRRDASLTLRLFDLEARPVDIRVSLTGFTAAMKVMMDARVR